MPQGVCTEVESDFFGYLLDFLLDFSVRIIQNLILFVRFGVLQAEIAYFLWNEYRPEFPSFPQDWNLIGSLDYFSFF